MKKNLNIAYLNGAEGMIRKTAASSGGENSEDFLYIRIPSYTYGFYTDIDVLNNKIIYYKQLDGIVTTYETLDEFVNAHGTYTLATVISSVNWNDKYASLTLINLNYQSPITTYRFDILSNKNIKIILADTNEECYTEEWNPTLSDKQKYIYSDGDALNSQNNVDIVDSTYIVDADGNKLFTFKKWNTYTPVE